MLSPDIMKLDLFSLIENLKHGRLICKKRLFRHFEPIYGMHLAQNGLLSNLLFF